MRIIGQILKAAFFITAFFLAIMFLFLGIDHPLRMPFANSFYNTVIAPIEESSRPAPNYCQVEDIGYIDQGIASAEVDHQIEVVRNSSSDNERCRELARLANSNFRDRKKVAEFVASYSEDKSADIRLFVSTMLGHSRLADWDLEGISLPILKKFLLDSNGKVRGSAITGIRSLVQDRQKAVRTLKEVYELSDTESRLKISQSILQSEWDDADAHRWLAEIYQRFPEHRLEIIENLHGNALRRSLPLLFIAAEKGTLQERVEAVNNLRHFVNEDPHVQEVLLQASVDPVVSIRRAAARSLLYSGSRNKTIEQAIDRLSKDSDPEIRKMLEPPSEEQIPGLLSHKVTLPKGISAYLETDKEELVLGFPEIVSFCVRNGSEKPFSFNNGGDYRGYRATRFEVTGIDENGNPVEDPLVNSMSMGGLMGITKVAPGESSCLPVNIYRYLLIDRPGSYRITISYDFYYEYSSDNPKPVASKEIKVRRPSAEEAKAFISELMERASLRTDKRFWPEGTDIEVIRDNIYLEPLLDALPVYKEDALEALTSIRTVEGTEKLVDLASKHDPDIRLLAIKELMRRVPISGNGLSRRLKVLAWEPKNRENLSRRTWSDKFNPLLAKISHSLLKSNLEDERKLGTELAIILNREQELSILEEAEKAKFISEITWGKF